MLPRFSMTPAVRRIGWMWVMAGGQRIIIGAIVRRIRYLRTAEGKSLYRYAEQFKRGDVNA